MHDAVTLADAPLVPPQAQAPTQAQPPAPAAQPAPVPPAAPVPAPTPAPAPPNPFAPPSPTFVPPPTAPGAHAAPAAAPGAPWPPPPGFAGGPYAPLPYGRPATNGLAVAALTVGCVGLVAAPIPLVFWIGGILALVAVGLGIGALVRAGNGAPRKGMAVAGTCLGLLALAGSVGGFFLTKQVVEEVTHRADQRMDREYEDLEDAEGGYPSRPGQPTHPGTAPRQSSPARPSKPSKPSDVRGVTSAVPFGETVTLDNGIQVTLSKPVKYKPETDYGRRTVKNAVQLSATITNTSSEPHEVIYAVPNVRDDKGMTAALVFDTTMPKLIKGSIMPGASATGVFAWEVPEGTTAVTADLSPGTLMPSAKFAGPIS
ncbi:DUF4190 domain-containing protein [Streptomyces antimicrobicus]|uniref:DUF4352 domain-containing protein n=1 Tax=Streptomyces antimicrobicus TaxID=2883108 RepID=A0ABS8B940_9ACTN|nr:DUF4190 domain-containing protein [Streptomyces antimicrobicus]MCB5181073.1 hypothetical protein [Streptomyces antimicrobicus]